jgi:hypothetical protein
MLEYAAQITAIDPAAARLAFDEVLGFGQKKPPPG